MSKPKLGYSIHLEDQILAFLIQNWPACYTVGEIANHFGENGMRIPNWNWCDGGLTCKVNWNTEYYDYVHDDRFGIDKWTYYPQGSNIGPRLNFLLRDELVVKIPPFNGGRANSWHASNDVVLPKVRITEELEELWEISINLE